MHGPFFKVDQGFQSTLLVRNSHLKVSASVAPILRLADGRELRLATISLAPDEVRMIDLAAAVREVGEEARSGAVSLEFQGAGPSAVNGLIVVKNERKSLIFAFPLRAGYAHGESRSLLAPWWLMDEEDQGALALYNSSDAAVIVHPSAIVRRSRVQMQEILLAPREAVRLDLRRLLRENGIRGVREGALALDYEGPVHAVIPGLFFFNEEKGYSVTSVFAAKQESQPGQETLRMGPSVLINKPDPAMGFPARLKVTPYALLSNTSEVSRALEIKATYELAGQQPVTVALPVAPLAPLETKRLDFSEYVRAGIIPEAAGQLNLQVTSEGSPSAVLARVFSMDRTRNYVFSTELTHAHGKSDSAYWNVAGNEYSAVMIQNVTEQEIEVRVTLHYNGGSGVYNVPVVKIPARATRNVDIRAIVRSGQADAAGNLIPPEVTFGSARVERADGRTIASFALLGAMYDPVLGMCGEVWIPCVGVFDTAMFNDPTTGFVGDTAPITVSAYWDNGDTTDETWQSSFSSHDPSIATIDNDGTVHFLSPGSTIGQANLAIYEALKPGIFECVLIYFVAASFLSAEPAPEVITDDVVVVAWVNADAIGLPGPANQQLVDNLNTPGFCSAQLAAWVAGVPVDLGSDTDRAYANAFLLKNSGNAEPPLGIDPNAFLAGGNFRLFNRFKVKFTRTGNQISNPTFLQATAAVGKTPDPCGVLPPLSAEAHAIGNGAKGLTVSGKAVYHLTEGRIGGAGQSASLTINGRTVPWIWTVVRFDAFGNLNFLDRAIFPTYYVYKNGQVTHAMPQSSVSAFISLDHTYQRFPHEIQ